MGIELEAYLTIPVFSSNSSEVKYTPIVSVQSTPVHTSRENKIHFPVHTSRENKIHFNQVHRWGTPTRYYIKYKQIKTHSR